MVGAGGVAKEWGVAKEFVGIIVGNLAKSVRKARRRYFLPSYARKGTLNPIGRGAAAGQGKSF
jgi:hypothetical protein